MVVNYWPTEASINLMKDEDGDDDDDDDIIN